MSLPTCPSCGQSVLEDNALDCPFCGAAMDGSRGAKNTPRPQAKPVTNRPGARKYPEKPEPAKPVTSSSSSTEPAKPLAKPVSGARGSKPVVDEDDPFGVGSAAAAAQAIQASEKPEKGRLHKVVCPMCERVGFIPKTAVGKSVRCANEKCMVPVFTATDPNDPGTERKPTRMSDQAEAARRAAESSQPVKRNPLVIYGVVGGILLALTLVILPLLTKTPESNNLNVPVVIDPNKFGPDDEETRRLEEKKIAERQAEADAINPSVEVAAHTKRMIVLARQPNLRDKAWARRMTGDLYLRLNDPTLSAQEFNQLLSVDRARGYYRIEPHLNRHWRAIAVGDLETAKKAMADAMTEAQTLPKTGRLGIDAALGLSGALVNDGKIEEAKQLIAARQLDTTIPHNRDAIASTAWSFVAFRCRDASLDCPPVQNSLLWTNPLHTAVAVDLAIHDRWAQAIAWSVTAPDPRVLTDALVAISEISAAKKAPAEVFAQIEAAVPASDVVSLLRVKAAVAAATRDTARLDACIASMAKFDPAVPVPVPSSLQLVQDEVPDRSLYLYQAIAVTEVVRAAALLGNAEHAATAMTRLLADFSTVAPATSLVRIPINQIASNEADFRKKLAEELRVTNETTFASMFRKYRAHLEQLARAAEDRRLLELILLARIVRAGGTAVVQQAIATSPELKQDLLLDELSGLLAISARQTGQQFPEVFSPDPSLRMGRALFGNAKLVVPMAAIADRAWAERDKDPGPALIALESGAGTDLPGMRQAMACELIESAARTTQDPGALIATISKIQNGIWREESYIIVGRVFADRMMDKKSAEWISENKIPALENISLLYGISLGILERPIPEVQSSNDKASAKQPASGV